MRKEFGSIEREIFKEVQKAKPDPSIYTDYMSMCNQMKDKALADEYNHKMRPYLARAMEKTVAQTDWKIAEGLDRMMFFSLKFSAPRCFDDYLQAVEYHRPLDKKFYMPRRCYLKPIVDAYQKVLDKELRFLSISLPKRAGKSQLGINFALMVSGLQPNKSTLMEGTGDALVTSFYNGCLEYLDPESAYDFYEIFPEIRVSQKNAEMKTLNLDKKSRFPTLMCRSIDSRQVGLSEATNLLYLDDCVEGREEAKNRDRLDDKWEVISGDIIGRAIEGTPIVICGTRYSLYDPIGHMQEEADKLGWEWQAVEIPALDPISDKSNYEFEIGGEKRFTTSFFREQRELLSAEQWESEFQQQPFEAKGILFPPKELNYYYELPVDRDPDTVIAVCDTADSGADFLSMPIAAVYGQDVYIVDVVFDDSPPEITKPECANAIINNKVVTDTFESNNAGSYFARDVADILKTRGYTCNIRTKRTISNKQTRIEFASDNIIKHFFFLDPSRYKRTSQYAGFMKQLTTYTRSGKVPHDDAPDSLSLLENELRYLRGSEIEIFSRPF